MPISQAEHKNRFRDLAARSQFLGEPILGPNGETGEIVAVILHTTKVLVFWAPKGNRRGQKKLLFDLEKTEVIESEEVPTFQIHHSSGLWVLNFNRSGLTVSP